MRVIYAISADGSDTVSYHTASNRGTRSIYLRRRISVEHDIPDDAFTVDVTVTNVCKCLYICFCASSFIGKKIKRNFIPSKLMMSL